VLWLQVVYDDGSSEQLWMGVQRVRLLITAGEELQRPSAGTLQLLARRWVSMEGVTHCLAG